MIVEYVRYRIEPARAVAFLAAYETAAESLRASPHCLGYELSQCTEARDAHVLRILWDSAEGHLQGFRKSAPFEAFFAAIRPYVSDIDEMRHYELTKVSWMR
jgi:quinol monooxygenase YgiN